jgi:hypothetical protein
MGRIRKKSQGGRSAAKRSAATVNASASIFVAGPIDFAVRYAEACGLAVQGRSDEARRTYLELDSGLALAAGEVRLRALVRNDLAALAALEGRVDEALAGWRAALEIDPDCLMARLNRDLIEAELSFGQMNGDLGELKLAPAPAPVPSPLVGEVATLPSPLVGEGAIVPSPLVGEGAIVPSPLVGEGGPQGRMGGGVGPVGPATTPAPPPWPSPIEGEGNKSAGRQSGIRVAVSVSSSTGLRLVAGIITPPSSRRFWLGPGMK